jgi:hypothetical protein
MYLKPLPQAYDFIWASEPAGSPPRIPEKHAREASFVDFRAHNHRIAGLRQRLFPPANDVDAPENAPLSLHAPRR